jgi:hypothetical protein
MRLIDADELKHVIHCAYSDDLEILEKIDEQPTIFDVDKVVESLMNRFRVVSNDEDLEWNRAIDYAIKIVEGGGVE